MLRALTPHVGQDDLSLSGTRPAHLERPGLLADELPLDALGSRCPRAEETALVGVTDGHCLRSWSDERGRALWGTA